MAEVAVDEGQRTATKSGIRRPEDTVLPFGQQLVYALQHVLTMFAGMITPPLIIGHAAGLTPAQIGGFVTECTFLSGVATIVQAIGIPARTPLLGSQLPVVQGASIGAVSTLVAIIQAGGGGLSAAFGSVIVVCLIGTALSTVWRYLDSFFPPVVTGCSVAIIGLALFPVAFGWSMGGSPASPDYGAPINIGLAAATLATIIIITRLRVTALSRISILVGIVVFTVVGLLLGKVDFSNVGTGSILALPSLFPFGFPTFHLVSILSMFIVVLVLLVEATAVFKAMGDILGTEVDAARVGRGLRSDMLFSALAPLIGALPCSTFAQNAGLVAMTGVKSRYVVATAGGLLVLIGLFPILGRIMAAIPLPVLGGAGVALFGAIAANGIQTLSRVDFSKPGNTVIVGVSLGIGLLPSVTPAFLTKLPLWLATIMHSGITSASITAVILNLVFNGVKTKTNATGEPSRGTVRQ